MMSPEDYKAFAKEAGIELSIENGDEDFMVKVDNPILNEINIARIKGLDLRTHYNQSNMDIEWFHFEFVERAYRHYKQSHALLDFTDLLEQIVHQPERLPRLGRADHRRGTGPLPLAVGLGDRVGQKVKAFFFSRG
jgi:hypothetical protein